MRFARDLAPNGKAVRLVWSQPASVQDRQRGLLPTALICILLGGAVMGAGGWDAEKAPRVFRAAAAGLLATGGLLVFVGAAALLLQKARKPGHTLTLAAPSETAGQESESSLRKEDQQ
ncbi:MAG: hypothetical protein ACRD00_07120 [Thermoanaerobaculia bacterium]